MDPVKASATAAGVAVARGAHRSYDQPPWVLDDPFALRPVGPQWAEIQAASETALPEAALRQSRASVVARSRYAEDWLISGGCRQYVILGAGLDSFAWDEPTSSAGCGYSTRVGSANLRAAADRLPAALLAVSNAVSPTFRAIMSNRA